MSHVNRVMCLNIRERLDGTDQTFSFALGDALVLYTDRLIEARSATNEEFGIERVEQIVRVRPARPRARSTRNSSAAMRAWTPAQQDDVTLVVLQRSA